MITKITEIKEEVIYVTDDGKHFTNEQHAEIHEKALELNEKMREIKSYKNAYYCVTQEDFDLLLDWLAHIGYNEVGDQHVPCYLYGSEDYKGSDWYFIDEFAYTAHKDLCCHKLKIKTLTDKKEEFRLMCEMYKELESI